MTPERVAVSLNQRMSSWKRSIQSRRGRTILFSISAALGVWFTVMWLRGYDFGYTRYRPEVVGPVSIVVSLWFLWRTLAGHDDVK